MDQKNRPKQVSGGVIVHVCTVDAGSVHSVADERLAGARIERNVAAADGFQDAQAVLSGVLERRIAVDGADAEKMDVGVMRG